MFTKTLKNKHFIKPLAANDIYSDIEEVDSSKVELDYDIIFTDNVDCESKVISSTAPRGCYLFHIEDVDSLVRPNLFHSNIVKINTVPIEFIDEDSVHSFPLRDILN